MDKKKYILYLSKDELKLLGDIVENNAPELVETIDSAEVSPEWNKEARQVITSDDVENWLGDTLDLDETAQSLADIANGNYTPEQLYSDIKNSIEE